MSAEAQADAAGQDSAGIDCGWRGLLGDLGPIEQRELVAALPGPRARAANSAWPLWAHRGQLEPPGDWATWVLMAGRGFGKTRAGAEWVAGEVRGSAAPLPYTGGVGGGPGAFAHDASSGPTPSPLRGSSPPACGRGNLRIALVAATIDEARRIMVDGVSGLIAVAGDEIESFSPTRRLLRFRNGAEATLFSGASPEALRGPEHHFAWCDELAKWEKPQESWDMLQFGLRLGDDPRAIVTTTPRPGPVLKSIMAAPGAIVTGGAIRANPHLPRAYRDHVEALYAGTRLGRQELEGELLTDAPGALWTVELLERSRVSLIPSQRTTLARVLIGVDPPAADGTCGIVASAVDAAGIGHVLADHSVTARSPEGWASAVAAAAEVHGASLVVAEVNQGGRMVESVLRAARCPARVKLVRAATGKSARADPVATLFEAGRVRLCGRFPALEAELCGLIAGGGYEGPGVSPDRADAMVWALTELMLGKEMAEVRVRGL